MRYLILLITLLGTVSLAFANISPPTNHNKAFSKVLNKSMPPVVNIVAAGKIQLLSDPFMKEEFQSLGPSTLQKLSKLHFKKSGSGVIFNAKKGLIVTNDHVIDQAQNIIVTLKDGRRYMAKPIAADSATDIAVIQIHAPHLKAMKFANSSALEMGDFVAAIGYPFDLQQTVTSGIVSGLHRSGLHIEGYENFIQTDAPINSGNSGGALVNSEGEMIGMNTAILSKSGGSIGIGFAIPSNMVKSIVHQLLKYGKIERGTLGIVVQSLNPQLSEALDAKSLKGAVVTQVEPYSPAAVSGVKAGDIIMSVNGHNITSNNDLKNIIGLHRIKDKLVLSVLRKGNVMMIPAFVGESRITEAKQRAAHPFLYGLTLKNTTELNSDAKKVQGVFVENVKPNTLAWTMGINKSDIITAANQQPVHNINQLVAIANKSKDHLLLQVANSDRTFFVLLS